MFEFTAITSLFVVLLLSLASIYFPLQLSEIQCAPLNYTPDPAFRFTCICLFFPPLSSPWSSFSNRYRSSPKAV
ncbi:hypothetical protein STCU_12315 [Strigomonas culicis]|uniref:Uncharacterized protein n=1 Tax=Strigomonas culicis TaxID=28005 RepID=S9TFQ5_9TRYP|nr:hypothetical protein STCU_12315 [Strigomonas culicis]|eukprot:EPY15148.1 hypothetical protein STCU_12315 [Strigomonas culicis]